VTTAQPPDPLLVNGWGIAASASSPWWVSAADSNTSLIYNATGVRSQLVVQVPGGPTGIVSSSGTGFVVTDGAASATSTSSTARSTRKRKLRGTVSDT
jgi:hypothetical protein